MRRAFRAFRFAPVSYLLNLRNRPRPESQTGGSARSFAAMFRPPPPPPASARHLLILSYLPLHYTCKMEMLFARGLQERGWRVSVLVNDATAAMAREYYGYLGVALLRIEDFLDFRERRSIRRFTRAAVGVARSSIAEFKRLTYRDAPITLNALASLTAAEPDGMITDSPRTYRRLGTLLRHSALSLHAAEALYRAVKPTMVLCQEKGFVGTCETYHAALSLGLDYVQWVSCHKPESVMFKRFRPDNSRDHPFSLSDAAWARFREAPWREAFANEVLAEFDRGYRSGDWFRYKKLATGQAFASRDELCTRLKLDPARKTAVIYSHILNDANLFYGTDLFPGGYEEWLVETVRAAQANGRVNWVLKLHPANVFRNARTGYAGEYGELIALRKALGAIPGFLKVVPPDERVSPVSFFGLTDWGITVRGTVGLELPCFGVPVLTAGTGRYAGKGFTVDSATRAEYLERVAMIDSIPPLTAEQMRLGILHAYLVFRARPARYDAVLGDTYPGGTGKSQRDLELRGGSIADIVAHPQMRAISDFLESPELDFLDDDVVDEICQR